tara:strand:+ start:476 stop:943 length:468 start_codon:yes stop_codon:yes gene_type:complete
MSNFNLTKYLAEGKLLKEAINLNDTLDTPQDLVTFITGGDDSEIGEAEKVLDDITNVEESVIGGETVWHNQGEFYDEDDDALEYYKENYFDVGKPLTKKDVIQYLLGSALSYDYHAEREIGDEEEIPDDWDERQDRAYSAMAAKAKDKYGIDDVY